MRKAILIIFICIPPSLSSEYETNKIPNPDSHHLWRGVKNPIDLKGYYFLPTGFVFDAVLENAIFSYNLATPAIAFNDEEVFYLRELVIPRDTRFIGIVQVIHSLDRVQIDFHTMVFPNGQEIPINFMALSFDGSAGIKGRVEKHKDAVAAKLAMRSVLSGIQAGAASAAPTIENSISAGLSQEALVTLGDVKTDSLESITIEERTPIKLFVRERKEY